MRFRLIFFLATVLFVVMNVLLWRSAYAPSSRVGTSVPIEVVWEKLMTSPDDSWLEIRHHGVKIGRAHWRARINEDFPDTADPFDDLAPDGLVRRVTGYSLDFSGTVLLDDQNRLRFDLGVNLNTNQAWDSLAIKLLVKPFSLEVAASAQDRKVHLITEEETRKERVYTFDDLRNPEKLLRDLGGPWLPGAIGAFLPPLRQPGGGADSSLVWDARLDRLKFGRTEMRVYRLEARLLRRYRAVLIVSPVGEVLRIELPDELVMVNDALINF